MGTGPAWAQTGIHLNVKSDWMKTRKHMTPNALRTSACAVPNILFYYFVMLLVFLKQKDYMFTNSQRLIFSFIFCLQTITSIFPWSLLGKCT